MISYWETAFWVIVILGTTCGVMAVLALIAEFMEWVFDR